MKTSRFLLPALLLFVTYCTQAQTADEIVDKYITAMGGKEKIASLKSVKMEGTMNAQGNDIGLVMTKVQDVGLRMDMDIMGSSNYQLVNQKGGVVFMPVTGMQDPQPMTDDQFKSAVAQLDLQGTLFNFKTKGTSVEYLGMDKVDGNDAYKLKATLKNGALINYFIDAKTNRIIKTSSKRVMNGQEMDIETTYSDFKQNADGFWFPYTTSTVQGTISFDKIETNVTVDPKIFEQ